MKRYRIGELAKMMCVSLDFIRFYEEKGLIEAWVDPKITITIMMLASLK